MFGFVLFIGLAALSYAYATRSAWAALLGVLIVLGSVAVFL